MADPWVAPDTPASPPPAPALPVVGAPPAPRNAARAAELPVLRPLTTTDILDGGLRTWKAAPATLAAVAAAIVVPAQVLVGYLTRDAVEDLDLGSSFTDALTTSGPDDVETGFGGDLFFVGLLVDGLSLALVTVAVARFVAASATGHRLTFGPLLGIVVRRSWAVALAWLLVHAVEAVFAIALLAPALLPMTWFAVVSAVVACEDAGPLRAMKRSYRLCRRRFGTVLGICLLTALVDAALSAALTAVGTMYLEADLPAGWAVNTAVSAAALLVTVPFVAAVVALLYLDLRARTEGLDIELAAGRVFALA
jgi:hypothetical protein